LHEPLTVGKLMVERMPRMKKIIALLLLVGMAVPAFARYEIFLSTSPDNKLRVAITQEVLRHVGDKVFFEYPIYLVNKAGKKLFLIDKGTVPYVNETDRGTFTMDFERAKYIWAEDSRKFFIYLEVSEGEKRMILVDVAAKSAKDVTDQLAPKMAKKAARKGWKCERPVIEFAKWHKKDLAIFHLTTGCIKEGDEKARMSAYDYWSIYDTVKKKLVKDCPGCKEEDALKSLTKEPKKKKPKPTPTPEETPTYRP
jgi:hypothetical protein